MFTNVVVLNFSPRNDGNCGKIVNFLKEHYNRTNVRSYHVRVESCANCDYECLKQEQTCPSLDKEHSEMMNTIEQSDLVYFIVPNYCGYPCANYFSFNERNVGYFNGDRHKKEHFLSIEKRFIIISNTENPFAEIMQQQTIHEPKILFLKSGKYRKRAIDGNLLDSDEAINDLQHFLDSQL